MSMKHTWAISNTEKWFKFLTSSHLTGVGIAALQTFLHMVRISRRESTNAMICKHKSKLVIADVCDWHVQYPFSQRDQRD